MCRLFGIIADKPINIGPLFFEVDTPFKEFIKSNPDGWGVGWYENNKPKIFKEGFEDSKIFNFNRIKNIKSHIIISHVRKATVGDKGKVNAHPFSYQNYLFAHNGTIKKENVLSKLNLNYKNKLEGDTDSEAFFMLVIQFLEETKNIIKAIRKAVGEVRKDYYSSLNFILSEGISLYVFRDATKRYEHFSIYYLEQIKDSEKRIIFSSEPLIEGADWKLLELGELLVVNQNLKVKKIKIK